MEAVGAELAKYGPTGVAIAVLALSAYILGLAFKRMDSMDQRHEEAWKRMSVALEKNTEALDKTAKAADRQATATAENNRLTRNLNGKLEAAVIQKATINQANVRHATFSEVK